MGSIRLVSYFDTPILRHKYRSNTSLFHISSNQVLLHQARIAVSEEKIFRTGSGWSQSNLRGAKEIDEIITLRDADQFQILLRLLYRLIASHIRIFSEFRSIAHLQTHDLSGVEYFYRRCAKLSRPMGSTFFINEGLVYHFSSSRKFPQ